MNAFPDTPAGIDGMPGAFLNPGYAHLEGLGTALFVLVERQ